MCRKRPFAIHRQGRLQARAAVCRIPCLILCLADVERVGQSEPVVELPHTGTIITDQPDVMWGTDATAAVTVIDGQVMVFAAIDPCTAECVGIQTAIHGDRLEDPNRSGKASVNTLARSPPQWPRSSPCGTITGVCI